MKSLIPFALLLTLGLLAGCTTTEETIKPVATTTTTPGSNTATTPVSTTATTDVTGQTLLSQGMFVSNVHSTSGTVNLYEKGGKRTLVFANFRTDGGPDLRIYLAENTGLRNFIEVSRLTSTSGNFSVELPTGADPAKQRYVLIWCKAFSVLFGSSELK